MNGLQLERFYDQDEKTRKAVRISDRDANSLQAYMHTRFSIVQCVYEDENLEINLFICPIARFGTDIWSVHYMFLAYNKSDVDMQWIASYMPVRLDIMRGVDDKELRLALVDKIFQEWGYKVRKKKR